MSSSASPTDQLPAKKRARTLQEEDSSPSTDETHQQAAPKGPSFQRVKELPAHEFFGDKFFYADDQVSADRAATRRRKKFGNKTALDVLREARDLSELNKILAGTGIESSPVEPYWEQVFKTAEDMLAGQQIALYCADYLESMSFYQEAMSFKLRRGTSVDNVRAKRNNDIHIVLGSSGSGKTAFAWKYLAVPTRIKESVDEGNKMEWCSFYQQAQSGFTFASLIEEMKNKIAEFTDGEFDPGKSEPLKINMALVIDEAAHLKGELDTLKSLGGAVSKLKGKLVTGNVRLILAGTGYDTMVDHISSQTEVFKYDMKPWTRDKIIAYTKRLDAFSDEDMARNVESCLKNYSVLSSLASNARMATILFSSHNTFDLRYLGERHDPGVVARLIIVCAQSYINLNGLVNTNDFEQKLVARAVLGQLQTSQENKHSIKPPSFTNLTLPDDSDNIISKARSLVEQNYERDEKEKMKLIDSSQPPVFVSPAIAVVLFWLLGASPTALAGWQLLEMIGALNLLKKAATKPVQLWNDETIRDFQRLRIDILPSPLPAPNAIKTLRIPCNLRSCIWINGPMAPFGDYFSATDKTIGQAKYVGKKSSKASISLFEECLKTGFLKREVVEGSKKTKLFVRLALLQALSKQASSHHVNDASTTLQQSELNLELEDEAYPEGLLLRNDPAPIELLKCEVNHEQGTILLGSLPSIPFDDNELKGWELHFFTNANSVEVHLSEGDVISVDRRKTNSHGELEDGTEKAALQRWTEANVRKGVAFRFVFVVKNKL